MLFAYPNDKRQNNIKIIPAQKNWKYAHLYFSEIFGLDSLKEWLNEAEQITEENRLSLREKLINGKEISLEDMYNRFFLCKTVNSAINELSQNQASLAEKPSEKTDNYEIVQFPNFKSLVRLTTYFEDKCARCGFKGKMDYQVNLVNGTWGLLCEKCGLELEKKLGEIEWRQ